MEAKEAYQLGIRVGQRVQAGLRNRVEATVLPLPKIILPHSPQAVAYRMGYSDQLKGRAVVVKG